MPWWAETGQVYCVGQSLKPERACRRAEAIMAHIRGLLIKKILIHTRFPKGSSGLKFKLSSQKVELEPENGIGNAYDMPSVLSKVRPGKP